MDILGQILWYGMFCTPLIIIPMAWKSKRKWVDVLLGILLAGLLSMMLYMLSLLIVFRDGMGPG